MVKLNKKWLVYNLNTIYGFILRDIRMSMSYKLKFFLSMISGVVIPVGWYFLGHMVKGVDIIYLRPYGNDLFAFLIIGVAFFTFFDMSIRSFALAIRSAQLMGTLEIIYQSKIRTPTYLIGSTLWGYIFAIFKMLIILTVSVVLLDLKISSGANIWLVILILILGTMAGLSLGLFAASFVMLYKSGDPVTELFYPLSLFFGSVYFPISVLPSWLRWISYLLPTYYSLDALRLILIKGETLSGIWVHIFALLVFIVVVFPIGVLVFNYTVKKAKNQGILLTY